jgi:ferredoxin--NADP+ reductase
VEDIEAGRLPDPPRGREDLDALLAERKPGLVTADGWRAINEQELERGRSEDRPRVKLAAHDELLAATKATEPA